jgi:pyocin large subunit-like protein
MDKFAQALKRLCAAQGGHAKVASAIEANPQTIHQIISGVLLPSGNARGVGPNLRKRLDKAYPGWADDAQDVGAVLHAVTDDEWKFLEDFRRLTDPERARYATEIAARAAELREYVERFINPIKNGQPAGRKS